MFFGNEGAKEGDEGGYKSIIVYQYNLYIDNQSNGVNYDEYKEQAAKMAEKVGESAKFYKDKALDWFSQFTQ